MFRNGNTDLADWIPQNIENGALKEGIDYFLNIYDVKKFWKENIKRKKAAEEQLEESERKEENGYGSGSGSGSGSGDGNGSKGCGKAVRKTPLRVPGPYPPNTICYPSACSAQHCGPKLLPAQRKKRRFKIPVKMKPKCTFNIPSSSPFLLFYLPSSSSPFLPFYLLSFLPSLLPSLLPSILSPLLETVTSFSVFLSLFLFSSEE
jgi:hypothetical protein